MRSLTNFLMFETIFDEIPNTSPIVYRFAQKVLNPTLSVVEADCNTKLGRIMKLGENAVGRVSLFSYGTIEYDTGSEFISTTINAGDVLTQQKVTALLTQRRDIAVRSIATCTSEGGLCQECIRGSHPTMSPLPEVGKTFQVTGNTPSKLPYLRYLSDTYSGSLLGFKSFTTSSADSVLPIREGLLINLISSGELAAVYREVAKIPSTDTSMLEYARSTENPLEKGLLLILMYRLFLNVKD